MNVKAYKYGENYESKIVDDNLKLGKAITMLEQDECDFIVIEEGNSFVELTKSSQDEIITNGVESD